jgi:hypothetical protein
MNFFSLHLQISSILTIRAFLTGTGDAILKSQINKMIF